MGVCEPSWKVGISRLLLRPSFRVLHNTAAELCLNADKGLCRSPSQHVWGAVHESCCSFQCRRMVTQAGVLEVQLASTEPEACALLAAELSAWDAHLSPKTACRTLSMPVAG